MTPAVEYTLRNPLHRTPGVLECAVGGEILLYLPDGERVFSLNASARSIWELCRGTHTASQIAAALAERFGGGADLLSADVCYTVRQLRDLGLVTAGPSGGSATTDRRRAGGDQGARSE